MLLAVLHMSPRRTILPDSSGLGKHVYHAQPALAGVARIRCASRRARTPIAQSENGSRDGRHQFGVDDEAAVVRVEIQRRGGNDPVRPEAGVPSPETPDESPDASDVGDRLGPVPNGLVGEFGRTPSGVEPALDLCRGPVGEVADQDACGRRRPGPQPRGITAIALAPP